MPIIFTYLRADCLCDVTKFLDLTSFRLLRVGSGHGSKILTRFHLLSYACHSCEGFVLPAPGCKHTRNTRVHFSGLVDIETVMIGDER